MSPIASSLYRDGIIDMYQSPVDEQHIPYMKNDKDNNYNSEEEEEEDKDNTDAQHYDDDSIRDMVTASEALLCLVKQQNMMMIPKVVVMDIPTTATTESESETTEVDPIKTVLLPTTTAIVQDIVPQHHAAVSSNNSTATTMTMTTEPTGVVVVAAVARTSSSSSSSISNNRNHHDEDTTNDDYSTEDEEEDTDEEEDGEDDDDDVNSIAIPSSIVIPSSPQPQSQRMKGEEMIQASLSSSLSSNVSQHELLLLSDEGTTTTKHSDERYYFKQETLLQQQQQQNDEHQQNRNGIIKKRIHNESNNNENISNISKANSSSIKNNYKSILPSFTLVPISGDDDMKMDSNRRTSSTVTRRCQSQQQEQEEQQQQKQEQRSHNDSMVCVVPIKNLPPKKRRKISVDSSFYLNHHFLEEELEDEKKDTLLQDLEHKRHHYPVHTNNNNNNKNKNHNSPLLSGQYHHESRQVGGSGGYMMNSVMKEMEPKHLFHKNQQQLQLQLQQQQQQQKEQQQHQKQKEQQQQQQMQQQQQQQQKQYSDHLLYNKQNHSTGRLTPVPLRYPHSTPQGQHQHHHHHQQQQVGGVGGYFVVQPHSPYIVSHPNTPMSRPTWTPLPISPPPHTTHMGTVQVPTSTSTMSVMRMDYGGVGGGIPFQKNNHDPYSPTNWNPFNTPCFNNNSNYNRVSNIMNNNNNNITNNNNNNNINNNNNNNNSYVNVANQNIPCLFVPSTSSSSMIDPTRNLVKWDRQQSHPNNDLLRMNHDGRTPITTPTTPKNSQSCAPIRNNQNCHPRGTVGNDGIPSTRPMLWQQTKYRNNIPKKTNHSITTTNLLPKFSSWSPCLTPPTLSSNTEPSFQMRQLSSSSPHQQQQKPIQNNTNNHQQQERLMNPSINNAFCPSSVNTNTNNNKSNTINNKNSFINNNSTNHLHFGTTIRPTFTSSSTSSGILNNVNTQRALNRNHNSIRMGGCKDQNVMVRDNDCSNHTTSTSSTVPISKKGNMSGSTNNNIPTIDGRKNDNSETQTNQHHAPALFRTQTPTPEQQQEQTSLSTLETTKKSNESGLGDGGDKVVYYTGCTKLCQPEDDESLSQLHCFMRSDCIEAFSATMEDVNAPRYGRFHGRTISIGQVGIRCTFCQHVPYAKRPERAVCFPSTLKNIYHSIETWQRKHLQVCNYIPSNVKDTIHTLIETSRSGAVGGRRQYWIESAQELGLIDTEDGIHFVRPPNSTTSRDVEQDEDISNHSEMGNDHCCNTTLVSIGSINDSDDAMDEYHPYLSPRRQNCVSTNVSVSSPIAAATKLVVQVQQQPRRSVVTVNERELVTDYLYTLLEQMEVCYFTEQDRTGGRSKVKDCPLGYPGFQCKHCLGKAGYGRYFPVSVRALTSANSDRNIYNHLQKCRRCPPDVKNQLQSYYVKHHHNKVQQQGEGESEDLELVEGCEQKQDEECSTLMEKKNRRGYRKIFFHRIWDHIMKGTQYNESGGCRNSNNNNNKVVQKKNNKKSDMMIVES